LPALERPFETVKKAWARRQGPAIPGQRKWGRPIQFVSHCFDAQPSPVFTKDLPFLAKGDGVGQFNSLATALTRSRVRYSPSLPAVRSTPTPTNCLYRTSSRQPFCRCQDPQCTSAACYIRIHALLDVVGSVLAPNLDGETSLPSITLEAKDHSVDPVASCFA
jgi:hypothetical protein